LAVQENSWFQTMTVAQQLFLGQERFYNRLRRHLTSGRPNSPAIAQFRRQAESRRSEFSAPGKKQMAK